MKFLLWSQSGSPGLMPQLSPFHDNWLGYAITKITCAEQAELFGATLKCQAVG